MKIIKPCVIYRYILCNAKLYKLKRIVKRRIQLLHDTRKTYSDKYIPPAVHPRYKTAYHSLYDKSQMNKSGSFGIRLFIALLILVLVYAMHYQEKSFGNINDKIIVNEIQREYLFR